MLFYRTAAGKLLIIAALLMLAAPVLAATISVDSGCSLTNAIRSANGKSQKHPKAGCERGSSGSDTIEINDNASITLSANLPVITGPVTILGEGSNGATLDGDNSYRIFNIQGPSVTLENLTLQNGRTNKRGGAIRYQGGNSNRTLTLDGVTVKNSWAQNGGGGIAVGPGKLILTGGSQINNNSTPRDGGGIWVGSRGQLEVSQLDSGNPDRVKISDNSADRGGGVFAFGFVEIEAGNGSTRNQVINNEANYGGGIYVWGAGVDVDDAVINDNSADTAGGAIMSLNEGGRTSGYVQLEAARFNRNSAYFGGAIMLTNSQLRLTGSAHIFNNNSATNGADVAMHNSSVDGANLPSGTQTWSQFD